MILVCRTLLWWMLMRYFPSSCTRWRRRRKRGTASWKHKRRRCVCVCLVKIIHACLVPCLVLHIPIQILILASGPWHSNQIIVCRLPWSHSWLHQLHCDSDTNGCNCNTIYVIGAEERVNFMQNAKMSSYHHSEGTKSFRLYFLVCRHSSPSTKDRKHSSKVRHKVADFWLSVIQIVAIPILKVGRAHTDWRVTIPGFKAVSYSLEVMHDWKQNLVTARNWPFSQILSHNK